MNLPTGFVRDCSRGFLALFPNCKEAAQLQARAFDHKLPPLTRAGLRLHLLICGWCRRYGRHLAFLRTATRNSAETEPPHPPRLSVESRERIRRCVQSGMR
jgi:hypothetical protein